MQAASRYHTMLGAIGASLAIATLVACTAVASPASESSTVDTVSGVGELMPGTFTPTVPEQVVTSDSATPNSAPVTDPSATTTTIPVAQTIGAQTIGNRVLMIGDSITASVSERYGGEACKALVPLGWQVEVDAEVGRFIDFGKQVLDKRLDAGWDAAVIFLGTNYGKDREVYQSALHALLLRLVPKPTVLITTSLFRPEQQEVNDAIAAEAAQFTSVTVIDWSTVAQDPSLTGADEIHLTEAGRRTLAYLLAATMGTAPLQPGACLKTKYTNDSAGSPYGPPDNTSKPKPTSTTTKAPANTTATTAKSTGSSTATTTANSTTTTKATGSTTATTATTPPTAAPTLPTVPLPTAPAPTLPTAPPPTPAPTTAAPTTAAVVSSSP